MASSSSSSPELSAPSHSHPPNPYKYSTIDEVLDDLSSRFILNLPDGELASLERICFQVEQAHWYYEDFIREENPKFPSLPLKKFSEMFFQACPLLERWSGDHDGAFDHFMRYKTRVPVCGAIMLNDTWDKVVLVKGWKSSSGWGFPKGKINQNEPPHECAAREVAEETGYNLNGQIDPTSVIEMEIREQQISLFVVPGVPEDFPFETKTRKEISKIEWFRLADLPTWKRNKAVPGKFYLISPFIGPLKALINERKPRKLPRRAQRAKDTRPKQEFQDESDTSAVEFHSRPAAHSDPSAQESSSQTSSVDNGDPQTPSPLYSEAVATHVGVAPATETNGLDSKAVDPHFARLLSALTLSAKPTPVNADDVKSGTAPTTENITPSSSKLHPVPDAAGSRGGSQTRAVLTPSKSTDTVVAEAPAATAHGRAPSKSSKKTGISILPNDPGRAADSSPSTQVSSPPPSATLSTTSSRVSASQSNQSAHSRGSSMVTADLSPYLSRPAGIPMNGKRLKQLALLETVADESSRMTPAPTARILNGPPSATQAQFAHPGMPPVPIQAPLPPSSVPPHNFTNLSPMYPNTQGPYFPPVPQTGHFNPPPPPDNVFTVRPRTSNSFRPIANHHPRPFNTRGSMNQAQLLSALSGTPASGFHRPPMSPMVNFHGPGAYPIPHPSVMPGAPIFQTGPHPPVVAGVPLHPHALPPHAGPGLPFAQGPLAAPGPSAGYDALRPAAPSARNSQLLSILNRGPGQ